MILLPLSKVSRQHLPAPAGILYKVEKEEKERWVDFLGEDSQHLGPAFPNLLTPKGPPLPMQQGAPTRGPSHGVGADDP